MSTDFLAMINSVFTDRHRSIFDLAQGATFQTILDKDFDVYFVENLLKKASGLDLGVDPTEAAYTDFLSFLDEQDKKFIEVSAILDNIAEFPALYRILKHARKLMFKFFEHFYVARMQPRFTSGATLTLERGSSVFARIKASEGQVTLLRNLEALYPGWGEALCDKIPHTVGSSDWYVRISSVEKQWNIDRIIGLGPSSALAHQCGFADYLVPRLRTFCGIDMPTAQSKHKALAQEHSLDGIMSTQDQRKASDNILKILAQFLLPLPVYQYMEAITPDIIDVRGVKRRTHMLCPAGNGYNSPFQTLLFWVLIKGIQMEIGVDSKVHVYGDDVIVHRDAYDSVCKVFPLLGLEINQAKSFKEGPFRESCGGDFLYGNNIRAFYAKNIPSSTLDWIKFVNGVRRIGYYNNVNVWRSDKLRRLWFRSILHIPKGERYFCPRHYGDAGINIECESLYDLQRGSSRSPDNSSVRYPNNGYDAYGNPYASERIKIYVARVGGERTSFSTESKGLNQHLVLRTLSSPFLVGAGQYKLRKPDFHGREFKYPTIFNGKYESSIAQYVPYTLNGSPPVDIDELFASLANGSGAHLSNADETTKRLYVKELIALLKVRVEAQQHKQYVDDVSREALQRAKDLSL